MDNNTQQLVLDAQSGNSDAFHKLVTIYDKRIMTLALQLTRNIHDAEDLYQEVFLKAFKKIKTYKFRSEFYTWLYRITVNTAINHKRKIPFVIPLDTEIIPDKDIRTDRNLNEVLDLINQPMKLLSRKQSTVFVLKYLQGLPIKSIAVIMNISEGTVKRYLFRAVEKIRKSTKGNRHD